MTASAIVPPRAALYGAMAKAFPEIEGATKDKANSAFRSKYADLGAVVDAIKPALVKHGLWFRQVHHDASDGVAIETLICHASGEELSSGVLYVPANKKDAQGYGSALTYARRYSLQTAFGVAPEDDDGNAAAKSAPAKQATVTANPADNEPGGKDDIAAKAKEWADAQLVEIDAAVKACDFDRLRLWRSKNDKALQRLSHQHPAISDALITMFDNAYSDLSANLRMAG
jgi:hypothetical protein